MNLRSFFTYNDDEILFDDDEHNQCTGNGNNKSPVVVAIAVKSKPLAAAFCNKKIL